MRADHDGSLSFVFTSAVSRHIEIMITSAAVALHSFH